MQIKPSSTLSEFYLGFINLAFEVAHSLKGKQEVDYRWVDIELLALKLIQHAMTIYWLRQKTNCPVPASPKGEVSFYDVGSVTVLTRAALETYLTLFEVFFEPENDDEFEFNHAFWQLSGFIVREKFPTLEPELQAKVIQTQKDLEIMRDRIKKTKKFASLTKGQKKEILKGNKIRERYKIGVAAGFSEPIIRQIYAYSSGFVHADALSSVQIFGAKRAEDQISFIEFHIMTVMIVLAKMIVVYAGKFSEAKAVCDKYPDLFNGIQHWSQTGSDNP